MNMKDFLTALCRGREGEDLKALCKKVLMAEALDKAEREHLAAVAVTLFVLPDTVTASGNVCELVRGTMKEAFNEVNRHPVEGDQK